MKEYKELVKNVLDNGYRRKGTRGGIDTLFLPNLHFTTTVSPQAFPLLTTKEVSWKNVVIENLWFLSGEKKIHFLREHGCKFWDPWADEQGFVPSPYGHYWRQFPHKEYVMEAAGYDWGHTEYNRPVDQVKWAIGRLKSNPNTRQAVITSWDPRNVITSSLPPCHMIQVLSTVPMDDGSYRLNLHLTQRSCDLALGEPYNIAGYSFLLCLYSRFLKMNPMTFSQHIVDAHVYTAGEDGSNAEFDHVPGLRMQLERQELARPGIKIDDRIQSLDDVDDLISSRPSTKEILNTFKILDYYPEDPIKFKPAV